MNDFFKMYPVEDASREDAVNYVSILYSLAAVDGIDEAESNAILQLVSTNGWDLKINEEAKNNSGLTLDSLSVSPDFISVVGPYLIRDLCAIAFVSNGLSDLEDAHIRLICEKVGVTVTSYEKIKRAVSAQLEVIELWSAIITG
jgi:hypothetical protein